MQTKEELNEALNSVFDKLRASGIIRTKKDFAELLDVDYSNLTQALKGNDRFLTDSLVSKAVAALNMHQGSVTITHSNVATGSNNIQVIGPNSSDIQDPEPEFEMIPVIPTRLYKESDVDILEYVTNEDNDVQMTPAIQQFPKTDAIYTVQTMAMWPHLHQGDYIALKAIRKDKPIVNGEMYAIDTKDLGILVRFAYDRGDKIELRSSDEAKRFEPVFILKDDIYTVFRVVGLIRTNI